MIIGYVHRDTRRTHRTFSHFPVGRLLKIISRNGDEPFVYRVRACAHARRCAAPERIPVCASVHSGREISKSKIVQLVSSGVSAAYVANVRHQGTKRDEKEGGSGRVESYTGIRSGSCLNLLHDFVPKLRVLYRYKYRVRNWSAF